MHFCFSSFKGSGLKKKEKRFGIKRKKKDLEKDCLLVNRLFPFVQQMATAVRKPASPGHTPSGHKREPVQTGCSAGALRVLLFWGLHLRGCRAAGKYLPELYHLVADGERESHSTCRAGKQKTYKRALKNRTTCLQKYVIFKGFSFPQ